MPLTIRISDVKNIGSLTFPIPPPGVFVLTGENGSGKTTLLACLVRIGEPDSFPKHFKTSKFSNRLDQFPNAQISYDSPVPGDSVSYTYSGYRWEPTPKRNGPRLLANSGYSEVVYVAADEARVTPRQEDFRTRRIRVASQFVQQNANFVLGTQKFASLKTVNVRQGVGQQAFVLEVAPNTFVSEKNFSLGELAVLKLLRKLETSQDNALVIIDELEIALHPIAQERLLRFLEAISQQKNLTIVFSTHSATLIRATRPRHLLFLERTGSVVSCLSNCYPSYALGRIAPLTDINPDVVLLVEDDHAQHLLQALVRVALPHALPGGVKPTTLCQPIGAWHSVLRFLARSQAALGVGVRAAALLDHDCKEFLVPPANHPAGTPYIHPNTPADIRAIYVANNNRIKFLPATPEMGLVNDIAAAPNECLTFLSNELANNAVMALQTPVGVGPDNTPQARNQAKAAVRGFVSSIVSATAQPEADVIRLLYRWYVARREQLAPGSSADLLGPLLI